MRVEIRPAMVGAGRVVVEKPARPEADDINDDMHYEKDAYRPGHRGPAHTVFAVRIGGVALDPDLDIGEPKEDHAHVEGEGGEVADHTQPQLVGRRQMPQQVVAKEH